MPTIHDVSVIKHLSKSSSLLCTLPLQSMPTPPGPSDLLLMSTMLALTFVMMPIMTPVNGCKVLECSHFMLMPTVFRLSSGPFLAPPVPAP